MRLRFVASLTLTLILVSAAATAQLNGGYTIDPVLPPGGRNFQSFQAATNALLAGVSGPVVFSVAPTTYDEAVGVTPVPQASRTWTVTFRGAGGRPTIRSAGAFGIKVDTNTRWIRFLDMNVEGGSSVGLSVHGDDNTFTRMAVVVPPQRNSRAVFLEKTARVSCTDCVFRGGQETMYADSIQDCVFDGCLFDGLAAARYLLYPINENDGDNVVQNCTFVRCSPIGSAIYLNLSGYGNMFWHNTIVVTSSSRAVHMGGCCGWSTASSWRNNIIVNLGTGAAIVYGETSSTNQLEQFDSDYNCVYAPNAMNGYAIRTERGTFRGSLTAWKQYLSANASRIIQAGGGTSYDQNSIEGDPQLMSLSSPVDVDLRNTSPLIDRGTTTYVPGPWMTFPATYAVLTDRRGLDRGPLVDIGASEYQVTVSAAGTATPGSTLPYALSSPEDTGTRYQCVTSVTAGITPLDESHAIAVGFDPLFILSAGGLAPAVFANYSGRLDMSGNAVASLNIPLVRGLIGLQLRTAFVTYVLSPFSLRNVSGTSTKRIQT